MTPEASIRQTASPGWLWLSLPLILVVVAWRAIWLQAVLPDTTAQADQVRRQVIADGETLIHFDGQFDDVGASLWSIQRVEVWDPKAPVWVVSGADQKPGRAGWDDNGDGQIDDLQELGAAWSDDYCSIDSSESKDHPRRIIDHGAFVPREQVEPTQDARYRFHFGR